MIETLMILILACAFVVIAYGFIWLMWLVIKALYFSFHVEPKLKKFWKKITTERMEW